MDDRAKKNSQIRYFKKKIFFASIFLFNLIYINCYSFDYKGWWENWYGKGGSSGTGSEGILAQYKADVINDFIDENNISTVIEFGCGDGVVLSLMNYKEYLGFDVSKFAIKMNLLKFKEDLSKSFMLYDPNYFINRTIKSIDLVVCLDVLYHVIDEIEYLKLLDDIFSFSSKYIILYTTLTKSTMPHNSPEIQHRDVILYLEKYKNYDMTIVEQKYKNLSCADFIFLTRKE